MPQNTLYQQHMRQTFYNRKNDVCHLAVKYDLAFGKYSYTDTLVGLYFLELYNYLCHEEPTVPQMFHHPR
jgi:hypothetical protein